MATPYWARRAWPGRGRDAWVLLEDLLPPRGAPCCFLHQASSQGALTGRMQRPCPDSGQVRGEPCSVLLGSSLKLPGQSSPATDSAPRTAVSSPHPATRAVKKGLRKPRQVMPSCLGTAPLSKLTGNWPLNPPGDTGRMRKNYGCGTES